MSSHGFSLDFFLAGLFCYPDVGPMHNFTGSRTVRWENKTMYCIATVFGLAI